MSGMAMKADAASDDHGAPTSAWIVVITKGMAERMTKDRLEAKGFEVYLPMRLTRHRFGGSVPSPLFPRYLFIRISRASERWRALFTQPGVARVMCTASRPIGISDSFIETVRKIEAQDLAGLGVDDSTVCAFKPGDRVVTLDGLVKGIFKQDLENGRVRILTSLLGGTDSRLVTVDLRKLAYPQSAAE